MSWFQLDSQSIATRSAAQPSRIAVPSLAESILRGAIGFTAVSVAGFAPWALTGRWLHHAVGELGLYVTCAVLFLGLSGVALHPLIIGPGSLPRFYKLFGMAFAAYAVVWIGAWMGLHGNLGSIAGLALGTALMAWIFVTAFDARSKWLPVFAALFLLNAAGYFGGGWLEAVVASGASGRSGLLVLAKLLWGVCYGTGLGAGLGIAFYLCQTQARSVVSTPSPQGSRAASL